MVIISLELCQEQIFSIQSRSELYLGILHTIVVAELAGVLALITSDSLHRPGIDHLILS